MMRILQAVTLYSSSGAYGGPYSVARNQCNELAQQGHEVTLACLSYKRERPDTNDQVQVQSFHPSIRIPALQFSGLLSIRYLVWLFRSIKNFDVVHVHTGRDLFGAATLLIARMLRVRCAVQTHGMIGPTSNKTALLGDRLLFRPALSHTGAFIALTPNEVQTLRQVIPAPDRFNVVPNGIAAPRHPNLTKSHPGEVLFCARLHPRKRPEVFVEVARLVLDQVPSASFAMVGPDEGSLPTVMKLIDAHNLGAKVKYEGSLSYSQTAERYRRAEVYVLPSVQEPFPMTVLESMSVGTPVVCTNDTGLSDLLARTGSAAVSADDTAALAHEVADLLTNKERARQIQQNAYALIDSTLSISAVATQLVAIYIGVKQ